MVTVVAIGWMVGAINVYSGSGRTAVAVGLVLALAPLEVAWTRHVFIESLARAATIWVFAELNLALAQGRLRRWTLAFELVFAIFLRYENALLFIPTALCGFLLQRPTEALRRGAILTLIVALPYGVWTARHVAVGLSRLPPEVFEDRNRPLGLRQPSRTRARRRAIERSGPIRWTAAPTSHRHRFRGPGKPAESSKPAPLLALKSPRESCPDVVDPVSQGRLAHRFGAIISIYIQGDARPYRPRSAGIHRLHFGAP